MLPTHNNLPGWLLGWGSGLVAAALGLVSLRRRRVAEVSAAGRVREREEV
jgi:hypothetical protein